MLCGIFTLFTIMKKPQIIIDKKNEPKKKAFATVARHIIHMAYKYLCFVDIVILSTYILNV